MGVYFITILFTVVFSFLDIQSLIMGVCFIFARLIATKLFGEIREVNRKTKSHI